jgi:hypothetical protein
LFIANWLELTVVCATTGACDAVVSTPRRLVVLEELLESQSEKLENKDLDREKKR